jgi:hypothetical protein
LALDTPAVTNWTAKHKTLDISYRLTMWQRLQPHRCARSSPCPRDLFLRRSSSNLILARNQQRLAIHRRGPASKRRCDSYAPDRLFSYRSSAVAHDCARLLCEKISCAEEPRQSILRSYSGLTRLKVCLGDPATMRRRGRVSIFRAAVKCNKSNLHKFQVFYANDKKGHATVVMPRRRVVLRRAGK